MTRSKCDSYLTINAGLRYTLNFPSTDADNQGAVFNLQTQELEFLGQNGFGESARRLHKLNFGPRLGIAYRFNDKTVARAGYGVSWIEQAGITTPFTIPQFPFIQAVSQRTLDNINPAFVLSSGPSVAPIPISPDAGRTVISRTSLFPASRMSCRSVRARDLIREGLRQRSWAAGKWPV